MHEAFVPVNNLTCYNTGYSILKGTESFSLLFIESTLPAKRYKTVSKSIPWQLPAGVRCLLRSGRAPYVRATQHQQLLRGPRHFLAQPPFFLAPKGPQHVSPGQGHASPTSVAVALGTVSNRSLRLTQFTSDGQGTTHAFC